MSASRHVRLRELLLGVEGLALLRHLHEGTDAGSGQRLEEIRRILDEEAFSRGEPTTEADPRAGYAFWAESYDEPGNQIIALEEPVVRQLVDPLQAGRALDAGCGTGRHTRYLLERGYEVLGIDITPEMLERAISSAPEARFRQADLREIPADDGHFDLVVCGLVLGHVPALAGAVLELARVLRPGGRMVISVLHPLQSYLGWQARFEDAGGQRRFVREHAHTHGDYLAAFASAGLAVRACFEPEFEAVHAQGMRRAFQYVPDAVRAAFVGLPGVLVWWLQKIGSPLDGRSRPG
jgi:SAM-dependent methyltransferase